jgi:hypothetical protein
MKTDRKHAEELWAEMRDEAMRACLCNPGGIGPRAFILTKRGMAFVPLMRMPQEMWRAAMQAFMRSEGAHAVLLAGEGRCERGGPGGKGGMRLILSAEFASGSPKSRVEIYGITALDERRRRLEPVARPKREDWPKFAGQRLRGLFTFDCLPKGGPENNDGPEGP